MRLPAAMGSQTETTISQDCWWHAHSLGGRVEDNVVSRGHGCDALEFCEERWTANTVSRRILILHHARRLWMWRAA